MNAPNEPVPPRRRLTLSQETIAIVTVGLALATLNWTTTGQTRAEAQAARAAWQAETRQMRAAWQAESQQLRVEWQAESRQLRDEARADREAFQERILQLTGEQARLAAAVSK